MKILLFLALVFLSFLIRFVEFLKQYFVFI